MMDLSVVKFIFKGIVIGLSIAAPVGPIGVLCIQRSITQGRQVGLAAGMGAATADAIYGAVASFGLAAISSVLVGQRFWIGLLGGLFLCAFGFRTFISAPAREAAEVRRSGLFPAYLTTLLLTLANPATILSFIAVFAGFGLGASPDYLSAGALVAGVFIGSALWWVMLSGGVAHFRERLTPSWMSAINRLSGLTLIGFGLYSLCSLRK